MVSGFSVRTLNATGEDDKYLKKPWFSSTDYGKTDQPVNFEYEKFELANLSVIGGNMVLIRNGICLHSRD